MVLKGVIINADLAVPQKQNQDIFEDAFEQTGHGKLNHLVLFTCGLMFLMENMELAGMSYVITSAACDLQLTTIHKGMANSIVFVGMICTAFLWGYLSDSFGRRAIMIPALFFSITFSILSSFSTNVWMLITFRFLTGCFLSGTSTSVYPYLGEMQTNSKRSAIIAWGSVPLALSFIVLPGIAWIMVPSKWSFTVGSINIVPWRAFVWSWSTPGLIALPFLISLPESPRLIFSAKGSDAALPILMKMYAWNYGKSPEDFPVKVLKTEGTIVKSNFAATIKNVRVMFQPPLLYCVLISCGCLFTLFMLSSGLYMWVPDIMNTVFNKATSNKTTICQIIHDKFVNSTSSEHKSCEAEVSVTIFPILMIMGTVFAVIIFLIGFLINKFRKQYLYCSLMLTCTMAAIGVAYVPDGISATILIVIVLSAGCLSCIISAINVEVFPTSLRSISMCVMSLSGRAGAAAGSYFLGLTLDLYCQEAFCFLSIFTAVTTAAMLFWPNPKKTRQEMESKGFLY